MLFAGVIGNVAARMAGYVEDLQAQQRRSDLRHVAFVQRVRDGSDGVVGRPVDGYVEPVQQGGNTPYVVSMVMSQ